MKLEVGMYLRNYYGRIAKVEYIVDDVKGFVSPDELAGIFLKVANYQEK